MVRSLSHAKRLHIGTYRRLRCLVIASAERDAIAVRERTERATTEFPVDIIVFRSPDDSRTDRMAQSSGAGHPRHRDFAAALPVPSLARSEGEHRKSLVASPPPHNHPTVARRRFARNPGVQPRSRVEFDDCQNRGLLITTRTTTRHRLPRDDGSEPTYGNWKQLHSTAGPAGRWQWRDQRLTSATAPHRESHVGWCGRRRGRLRVVHHGPSSCGCGRLQGAVPVEQPPRQKYGSTYLSPPRVPPRKCPDIRIRT